MKTLPRSSRLAVLALFAAGCSVNSLLDRSEAESEETIDLICACSNVFPDRAACEAQFRSFFDPFDRDCVEDALATDKKASKKTLECILDHQKEYNRCLEDMLDCNDSTSYQGCQPILERQCPELPMDVRTALSACDNGNGD